MNDAATCFVCLQFATVKKNLGTRCFKVKTCVKWSKVFIKQSISILVRLILVRIYSSLTYLFFITLRAQNRVFEFQESLSDLFLISFERKNRAENNSQSFNPLFPCFKSSEWNDREMQGIIDGNHSRWTKV